MIRKEGNEYVIYSEKGKRLGSRPTEKQAEDRLEEIEYFKRKGKEKKK
jgi:hypothetical protein